MWESTLAKQERGEDVPVEEHNALLSRDLFKGLTEAEAQEEADYVVRYLLHGFDMSTIPWRGSREAENWFAMRSWGEGNGEGWDWGEERQAEKLRNMVEASARDPDYWEALNLIAARLHEEGQPFPAPLAKWAAEVHRGERTAPPKPQAHKGQPPYANDNRNATLAYVFSVLLYLGLPKMMGYTAVAEACDIEERTVMDAIKKAGEQDGRLPAPWECWPFKGRRSRS